MKSTIITFIIGIILLAFLIYVNEPSKIVDALEQSNLFLLLVSTLFLILMHIIMAFRIRYVGTLINERISLKDAFDSHMLGMLLSEFTPGRSGYFLSSAYLKKKGHDGGKSLAVLVAPQPFDFLSKFIGASVGFFVILNSDPVLLIIPFVFVVLFFSVVFSRRVIKYSKKIAEKTVFKVPFLGNLSVKLFNYVERMNKNAKIIIKKWHVIMGFVALSYTSRILNWYLLFLAVNLTISNSYIHDFLMFYLVQPLINIVEFIPLPTPAGTGFSESASILVLSKFGISSAKALVFALLARIQTVVVSFIFGYLPLKETASYVKKKLF